MANMAQNNPTLSNEIVNTRLKDRRIELISDYTKARDFGLFKCHLNHEWSSRVHLVLQGYGCPTCNGGVRLTKDDINERLSDRKIVLIGEYSGNVNKKSLFKCEFGHTWLTGAKVVMRGNGCPTCAKYGFKSDRPAYIYILIFDSYLKYGITNSLESRLKKLKQNGEYKIHTTVLLESGKQARDWENMIKRTVGGNFVSKHDCSDGYTETLPLSTLDILVDSLNSHINLK